MERLFAEGTSLTINLRSTPVSIQGYLPRSGPSSWSPEEPGWEAPPSYQDGVEGRIENRLVDPEMPPLGEVPLDDQSGKPTNIFTSRVNIPIGKCCFGANIAHIPPRGRGLSRINNNVRITFQGLGRPSDSE